MTLKELLGPFLPPALLEGLPELSVQGLSADSRQVKKNDLFCAILGTQSDGRKYIQQAMEQGAVAVLYESSAPVALSGTPSCPYIPLPSLGKKLSALGARFYGAPTEKMHLIGVTGTNGKTTVTQLLSQALELLGTPTLSIGTLGVSGFRQHIAGNGPTGNTTPGPLFIQQLLAQACAEGIRHCVMEVTSHALVQGRVSALSFKTAIFTNLTHDHLDYHGSMAAYGQAKAQLFSHPGLQTVIVNGEDPAAEQMRAACSPLVSCWRSYPYKPFPLSPDMIYVEEQIPQSSGQIALRVHTPWGALAFKTALWGSFNISNLLAVIGVLAQEGYSLDRIATILPALKDVPGRLERFGGGPHHPLVVLDYAHTPDALLQVLKTLRDHCSGQLICIFGCGGDRDRMKRPIMGRIAQELAHRVVITTDNPRGEDPAAIIQDIQAGGLSAQTETIIDREEAIVHTIEKACAGDVILVAGKGHEQVQIIGDRLLPWSDAECIQKALQSRGTPCV